MKLDLLEYLVCPRCQVALDCQGKVENGDEVETGWLCCPQCEERCPILRGIPRFVTVERPLSGRNVETAAAFGWEWQEFRELYDLATCEAQFFDWIYPIEPDFFEGKAVLDAGCGMGRFSLASSKFGAKMVLAVDASGAVDAARDNTRDFSNVHVIQGDIHHLPLRRGQDANDYLAWLGQFQFRHGHHVVFEHLIAPVAFYLRREEFEAWFHEASMEVIDMSWRNRNSWRGHGRFA